MYTALYSAGGGGVGNVSPLMQCALLALYCEPSIAVYAALYSAGCGGVRNVEMYSFVQGKVGRLLPIH